MGAPFAICVVCGDRIGFYETAVALEADGDRPTSLIREPRLEESSVPLAHLGCRPTAPKR